jgi:hypothetical protein
LLSSVVETVKNMPAAPEPYSSPNDPVCYDDRIFPRVAFTICCLGGGDDEVASALDVTKDVVGQWKSEHKEFRRKCEKGAEIADNQVVTSLYRRAIGYRRIRSKILNSNGAPTEVRYFEEVLADVRAIIFWLTNRLPNEWKHPSKIEPQKPMDDPLAELYESIVAKNQPLVRPEAGILNPDAVPNDFPQEN